jgi:hypothetical protein
VHWIQLAEDNTVAYLLNTAKNLRVPQKEWNRATSLMTVNILMQPIEWRNRNNNYGKRVQFIFITYKLTFMKTWLWIRLYNRHELESSRSALSKQVTGLTVMNWSPRDLHSQIKLLASPSWTGVCGICTLSKQVFQNLPVQTSSWSEK